MDNLTHSLAGLLITKTGLERLSPYATLGAIVAANAPDFDLVYAAGGQWSYLQHHRGLSHSIVGTLAISLMVPAVIWLVDRLIAHFRGRAPRVRLPGLALVCVLAGATHPLLDWTNNYGVRPFMPWSDRWVYGDLVFILDPYLWLVLGGAAFLLTAKTRLRTGMWIALAAVLTTALVVARFVAVPSPASRVENFTIVIWFAALIALAVMFRFEWGVRWKTKVALTALMIVPIYWTGLAWFHRQAIATARMSASAVTQTHNEELLRLAAMPTFGTPFRWQVLAESDGAVYRFAQELRPAGASAATRFVKPAAADLPIVNLAVRDPGVRVLLGFARFPLARVEGDCSTNLIVRFADLRYTEPGSGRAAFSADVPVECREGAPAALPPP